VVTLRPRLLSQTLPSVRLKDIAELFVNNSATFKTTDRGRKSTLCVERLVNDLR
jgi:hypothetical protein